MKDIRIFAALFLAITVFIGACDSKSSDSENQDESMKFDDPHSFARPNQVTLNHLDLDVTVDFDNKQISGTATWKVDNHGKSDSAVFDTDGLDILSAKADGKEVGFNLGTAKKWLGAPLAIPIEERTQSVSIEYKTTPGAKALMWLNAQQTAGKEQPFLFTQSQAILARSWIPCPDGPGMRFTYNAKVKVPKELLAVMSADNPTSKNESGEYSFEMKQPIPAYLMALAVGDIEFADVGERTGVYAEPSVIEKAVYEFGEMEDMLTDAEKLYGPYRWERYDLIVLPPSFPFGGMENPRLTFATPTILAGDRSLTALVAHELAHSWSGNLVTNATWDDFWLNEGFTVYFERRIMEELKGRSYSEMLAELGYQDLEETVEELTNKEMKPKDTHLKLDLQDRNPDDGMTNIAYEKGYFFLRLLEETVGREKFDAFLKGYFEANAFKVMTTEMFVEKLKTDLFEGDTAKMKEVGVDEWIYSSGIPANVPKVTDERFAAVNAELEKWKGGTAPGDLTTTDWSSHEWLHFLRNVGSGLSVDQISDLDKAFGFTNSGNSEILAEWFKLCINHGYTSVYPRLEEFLLEVGRRKFLKPLYEALSKTDEGKEWAKGVYEKARPNYHSVSTGTIDQLLGVN